MSILNKFKKMFGKKRCSDAEFSKEYSFLPLLEQWTTPDEQKQKVEHLENIGNNKEKIDNK